MPRFRIAFLVLIVFASTAFADTLLLKDGKKIEGTFIGATAREVTFMQADNAVNRYDISTISAVFFGLSVSVPAAGASQPVTSSRADLPTGTRISVITTDEINSDITSAGKKYVASVRQALSPDGRDVLPKGTDVQIEVVSLEQSGPLTGRDEISLRISEVRINGQWHSVFTDFPTVQSSNQTNTTARNAGIGAGIGAAIGGIAGRGRGAVIGAAGGAAAGAAVAATRGKTVRIPSESTLEFIVAAPR